MHLDTFVKMVKMPVFHRNTGGLYHYDDDHEISASVRATDMIDHSYESCSEGDGFKTYLVIIGRH